MDRRWKNNFLFCKFCKNVLSEDWICYTLGGSYTLEILSFLFSSNWRVEESQLRKSGRDEKREQEVDRR